MSEADWYPIVRQHAAASDGVLSHRTWSHKPKLKSTVMSTRDRKACRQSDLRLNASDKMINHLIHLKPAHHNETSSHTFNGRIPLADKMTCDKVKDIEGHYWSPHSGRRHVAMATKMVALKSRQSLRLPWTPGATRIKSSILLEIDENPRLRHRWQKPGGVKGVSWINWHHTAADCLSRSWSNRDQITPWIKLTQSLDPIHTGRAEFL